MGKVDPDTKKIVPTKKRKKPAVREIAKQGPVPITFTARRIYGATYIFDKIGEQTGVTEDLKKCFPDNYRQLLSIAYYLILEAKSTLSRFPHWAVLHRHPHGDAISSQRSS